MAVQKDEKGGALPLPSDSYVAFYATEEVLGSLE